jgi:hypothetical protein
LSDQFSHPYKLLLLLLLLYHNKCDVRNSG